MPSILNYLHATRMGPEQQHGSGILSRTGFRIGMTNFAALMMTAISLDSMDLEGRQEVRTE